MMATRSPPETGSAAVRTALRARIVDRIADLRLSRQDASETTGLSLAQLSRLHRDEDLFSSDRLIEAAEALGLVIRLSATRPYARDED